MGQKLSFPKRPISLKKPYFLLDINNQTKFFYNFEKNLKYCLQKYDNIIIKTKQNKFRFQIFTINYLYHINFYSTSVNNTIIEVKPIRKNHSDIIDIDNLINDTFNMYSELEYLYILDTELG